jgi:hypothetical protein
LSNRIADHVAGDDHLHAAIKLAAGCGSVVGHRLGLAQAASYRVVD